MNMKIYSSTLRSLETLAAFLFLFSHGMAFSQGKAGESAPRKQENVTLSTLHPAPSEKLIQHASPEKRPLIEDELHLDPYEKIIQQNIDRRLDSLKIEEKVNVFAISYFAVRNVTDTEHLGRARLITPDYQLGPGDEIVINITGIKDKTMNLLVSSQGTVSVPEFGPVFVWGKTLLDVSATLREIIQSLYRNVKVEVDISKPRLIEVYITGEVVKPGAYQLTGMSTILDLLYLCGGPTEQGSFRQIVVSRTPKYKPVEGKLEEVSPGTVERIVVDLYDIFIEGSEKSNVTLQSGDRIVVPPVGPTVALKGAVKRARRYEFVTGLTMEKLIELGGGFLPGANTSRIRIRRLGKFGFSRLIEVDFNQVEGKSFPIADGDEVLVSRGIGVLQGFVFISGNVWYPGQYKFTEGMKLSELIEKAGGCLWGTHRERVDILRFISRDSREVIQTSLGENLLPEGGDDVTLKQWDIVKVYAETDVEPLPIAWVEGEIRNPGLYPIRENMRVQDLIVAAGGLTHLANARRAELLRITEHEQTIKLEIDLAKIRSNPSGPENIFIKNDDKLIILRREDMYSLHEVTVEGEVRQPGKYKIAQGERLSDLILKAGGLTENAYRPRAELLRVDELGRIVHRVVDLNKALTNRSSEHDIEMEDGDRLKVLRLSPLEVGWHATIEGEVKNAGKYRIVQGSRVHDLIMKAGGLTDEPYMLTAILTRYSSQSGADIIDINLIDVLSNPSSESNILLQDLDNLRIYRDPARMKTITVNIGGQVEIPGAYTLLKGARLSEALQRAGGIRTEGYKYGIIIVRKSLQEIEDAVIGEIQQAQERELLRLQAALVESAVTNDEKQLQLRIAEMRKRIITLLGNRRIQGRFIFDPDKDNPVLEDGDIITVPTLPRWVMIVGAVYGSGSIIYRQGMTAQEYIDEVGGMTPHADEEQVYVIKPNGVIKRGKEQLDPITPGDIIVIPPKLEDHLFAFALGRGAG